MGVSTSIRIRPVNGVEVQVKSYLPNTRQMSRMPDLQCGDRVLTRVRGYDIYYLDDGFLTSSDP